MKRDLLISRTFLCVVFVLIIPSDLSAASNSSGSRSISRKSSVDSVDRVSVPSRSSSVSAGRVSTNLVPSINSISSVENLVEKYSLQDLENMLKKADENVRNSGDAFTKANLQCIKNKKNTPAFKAIAAKNYANKQIYEKLHAAVSTKQGCMEDDL